MYKTRSNQTLSRREGFTLVELIVVAAVLGVLATMALPALNDFIKSTRTKRSIADIRTIDKAIVAYIIEKNALPVNLADVGMSNQLDPWGQPYHYQDLSVPGPPSPLEYDVSGDPLNSDYDLYSCGADGVCTTVFGASSADDIVRINNGSFAGERP